ncbi:MAG: hypothetical protein ACK5LY_11070 [Lachnospirales bacterium]
MFDDLLKKAGNLGDMVNNLKDFDLNDLSVDKIKDLLTDDIIQKYTKHDSLDDLLEKNNIPVDALENLDLSQLNSLVTKTSSLGSWKELVQNAVTEKLGK